MASLSGADASGQRPNHDARVGATSDAEGAIWIYQEGVTIPDDVTRVRVPTSVTTLPDRAFEGRTLLTEVDLPGGLSIIEVQAFFGCTSLRRVELPSTCESVSVMNLPEGLRYIAEYAFYYCCLLKRIELPSTLENICVYAFMGCDSLEEVKMTGGILTIGEDVFIGCSSLVRITIPSPAFVPDDETIRRCRLVTDGHLAIHGRVPRHTIIATESLASIPLAKMAEIQHTIGEIMNNREGTSEQQYKRIRALITSIKKQAFLEISTILELALWKKKMAELHCSVSDIGARVECRTRCGADAIVRGVLSYL